MTPYESRITAIGAELFKGMEGNSPGVFNKAWWSGQVLDWAMKDPDFKTEMFRFVDVFPVLDTPEEINRHIQEYLLQPGLKVPTVIKMALKGAGLGKLAMRMASGQIAKNLEGMAKNFIAGVDAQSAYPTLEKMRKQGQGFTVDLLGEATVSEAEADAYVARYRDLINGLADRAIQWKAHEALDTDDRGPIPVVNVSIKPSAMYSQLDVLDYEASVATATERLLPVFQLARERGVFLNLDMESHSLKDLTLSMFKRVLEHPSMAGFENAGVVIQAYHREAENDLRELIEWASKHGTRITVRLVKGAYWDYETVKAQQEGWPSPVWLDKSDSDACFERCVDLMLSNHQHLRSAIGSHNVRSIACAIAAAEHYGVPENGYEIQCLYGMAEPIKAACVDRGLRLRVYCPVGELIPGMAYLVRRLLENTSNESWLRQGFAEGVSQETLLGQPDVVDRNAMLRAVPAELTDENEPAPFCNEPLRDFTQRPVRHAFRDAVEAFRGQMGQVWTPIINGQPVETGQLMDSINPSDGSTVVGRVHMAGIEEAEAAVAGAQAAFADWRATPARERAALLFRVASLMRKRRDELSAVMTFEVGKPWREADADVAEAIDFLEYYGREMLRLDEPRLMQVLPGEMNHLSYQARGVCVVIAPWNFPLAILAGMASAAVVTGNTVILKPAEQSMVIGARLMALFLEAGVPSGVMQFLPGLGETVGAHLVAHRDVTNIVFTGSRAVGLEIWRTAGNTLPGQPALKRVVCEMGGKNGLIVDSDADLDEAVEGTLHSAFGFAGQKCSACSRAIVLAEHYDEFVERLSEAARSLTFGPTDDPGPAFGPVVDETSHRRLRGVIDDAVARGVRLVVGGEVDERAGYFVAPTIFADVDPDDVLATEEFFGPILAVIKADDFDHALAIANGTEYALTGGLFSRSPKRIARTRTEFRVGNLYINRSITGAIVGRQPFGGGSMSGGGTKAGGPDYLLQFLDPRTITENTLRRGFAPESQ